MDKKPVLNKILSQLHISSFNPHLQIVQEGQHHFSPPSNYHYSPTNKPKVYFRHDLSPVHNQHQNQNYRIGSIMTPQVPRKM